MSAFATVSPIHLGAVVGGAGKSTGAPTAATPAKQPENIGNDAIGGALSGIANNFHLGGGSTGSFNSGDFFKGVLGSLLGAAQGALTGLAKKNGAAK